MGFLIPSHAARSGDDPIFAAQQPRRNARALAGEPVINATVGALLDDDGKLALIGGMAEAFRAVPAGGVGRLRPHRRAEAFRSAPSSP